MKKQVLFFTAIGFTLYFFRETIERYMIEMSKNWNRFDSLFNQHGLKYGVSAEHLKAFALNESSLGSHKAVAHGIENPKDIEGSKSEDGLSWGIMQMIMSTAKSLDPLATQEKLNNPDYSIKLSAQYISQLQKTFDSKDPRYWEYVVKSYNQGPGNTRKREVSSLEPTKPIVEEYWQRWLRNLDAVRNNKGVKA